jgi:methyl-accepting chemotaxis protein
MRISNLKVAYRLALGFGAVITVVLVAAGISSLKAGKVHDAVQSMVEESYPQMVLANNLSIEVNRVAGSMRELLIVAEPERAAELTGTVSMSGVTIGGLLATLSSYAKTPEETQYLRAVEEARANYGPHRDRFLQLVRDGELQQARSYLLNDMSKPQIDYYVAIDKLFDYHGTRTDKSGKAAASESKTLRLILAGAPLAAALLALAIALMAGRTITRPLSEAVSIARRVADCDLTAEAKPQSADEAGQLMRALGDMVSSLSGTVGTVRASAESMARAADEIASGNADLSARTESQASTLQETASSMVELTQTVKNNAGNARHANQLVMTASGVATRGGHMVDQVVDTMSSIRDSSRQIADIINVIDGIAFQTNILALNAAVEAARAGEEGRGFAVVASEVRNLAKRSSEAAREIRTLITNSVEKVDAGSKLVDDAGITMKAIVDSVSRVAVIMNDIAIASEEQSVGIEKISKALGQVDMATQQNAALCEQATAAAESVRQEARTLAEAVARFSIARGETAVPAGSVDAREGEPAHPAWQPGVSPSIRYMEAA